MADKIVTQDPTLPGVNKLNGPTVTNGQMALNGLSTAGAVANDVITLSGGNWVPFASSGVETASNLGAGAGVFASKVGADFQFKSLVAGSNITLTPTATDITIASTGGGIFTLSFTSTDQVITSGGALTLAHGLGVAPKFSIIQLRNITGEFGYIAGDLLFLPIHQASTGQNCGVVITSDATNLYIRFGNTAQAFAGLNNTTGVLVYFTNANWSFIGKAFA